MGRPARELERQAHDAEEILMSDPGIPAVHHHRGVDAREDAAFDQLDLAASAFLGRRADHKDASLRQPVTHCSEGGARTRA
jgi:hypothetical protein